MARFLKRLFMKRRIKVFSPPQLEINNKASQHKKSRARIIVCFQRANSSLMGSADLYTRELWAAT